MATTKFEYHSAWTDSLREEGELRATRRMLLEVLAARSIEVSAVQRERVESTEDLEQLRAWHLDAIRAESSEDVFI
ncbi:hypothetical protein [Glycomyces xiaoerkulensis]|uniref:hypothetical protein n=1 Tax=Glycomyces xiaoerkulensis TaxID=2038139 RepID=UPI0012FFD618|nr:hypothetical protein [Glycomyces xiaoerkulensis]